MDCVQTTMENNTFANLHPTAKGTGKDYEEHQRKDLQQRRNHRGNPTSHQRRQTDHH